MREPVRRCSAIVACAAALLATVAIRSETAQAQEMQEQALEQEGLAGRPAPGAWSLTLGGGVADVPRYPGASTNRARFVPLADVRYGERLSLGPFGLRAALLDWHGFRAGPVLGFEGGREDTDDPHLAGLGDISPALTAGLFGTCHIGSLEFLVTARQAITHTGYGLDGLAQAEYRHALLRDTLHLRIGPAVEFADARHQQTWFGVSASQSATSGLASYTPDGGIDSVGVHANLTYRLSEHVLWRFFADVRRLSGDAAASPIVERRSDARVGLGFAYHFDRSQR